MQTNGFSVHVHRGQGAIWLTLAGELDVSVVAAIEDSCPRGLTDNGRPLVVINVAGLQFCDLAGARELLRFQAAGAVLVGTPGCLRRLFELAGWADRLPADARDEWPAEWHTRPGDRRIERRGAAPHRRVPNIASPEGAPLAARG